LQEEGLYSHINVKGGNKVSIEFAKAFMERMKTNEEFATKVTACPDAE
jgi:hypothetical protein